MNEWILCHVQGKLYSSFALSPSSRTNRHFCCQFSVTTKANSCTTKSYLFVIFCSDICSQSKVLHHNLKKVVLLIHYEHMVLHNLNRSSQCPVTYFMGGTGAEHLAVQMDEKHTGQRKLITAHFPSILMVCCGPICSAKKSHKLWLKLRESSYLPCCFVACHPATSRECVCVCLRVCPWLRDSSVEKCQTPQALDVSCRPPHLHDHVSRPVGEKAAPQRKEGRRVERFYITRFNQLRVQSTAVQECLASDLLPVLGTGVMEWCSF